MPRLRLAEYDRLYEQSRSLADDRARTALFHRMNDLRPCLRAVDLRRASLPVTFSRNHGSEATSPIPLLRYQWKFYDVAPR